MPILPIEYTNMFTFICDTLINDKKKYFKGSRRFGWSYHSDDELDIHLERNLYVGISNSEDLILWSTDIVIYQTKIWPVYEDSYQSTNFDTYFVIKKNLNVVSNKLLIEYIGELDELKSLFTLLSMSKSFHEYFE